MGDWFRLDNRCASWRRHILRECIGSSPAPLPLLRVANATEAELQVWADRILDCDTLEAVFDPSV